MVLTLGDIRKNRDAAVEQARLQAEAEQKARERREVMYQLMNLLKLQNLDEAEKTLNNLAKKGYDFDLVKQVLGDTKNIHRVIDSERLRIDEFDEILGGTKNPKPRLEPPIKETQKKTDSGANGGNSGVKEKVFQTSLRTRSLRGKKAA